MKNTCSPPIQKTTLGYTSLRPLFSLIVLLLGACSGDNTVTTAPASIAAPPKQLSAPPIVDSSSARFNGLRSNYTISNVPNGIMVRDNVGGDGSITLPATIKALVFTDVSINLQVSTLASTISANDLNSLIDLYLAYFNRLPDANGLSYWITQIQNGMSLDQIGTSFYASALIYSAQTGYVSTMSNADFITIIYKNVLGRTSVDQQGLDYWSSSLNSGAETRGTLVRKILGSAHTFVGDATYGWVAQLLDNKNTVAKNFSVTQGVSYISDSDSITKTIALASSVTPTDTSVAQGWIKSLIGVQPNIGPTPTAAQAARFLQQSSFGATNDEINKVVALGYSSWINNQFSLSQNLHRSYMDKTAAGLTNGLSDLTQNNFFESFWQQAITGDDQLRQRVAFALSQIMVVSFQDSTVANYPRGVASFYDTLATNAFGNFRNLLEAVSLHPVMGMYLTSIKNQKESDTRVPDENYAREVMQLFTIGLYQLNPDGSNVTLNGKPVETYSNADITGLAKVFTGWSWAGADKTNSRFFGGSPDPNRDWMPMQAYPNYHSISAKTFLGVTIPAQSAPAPEASLKTALDTLFNHPNVGPFISRELIQRLVTSNPSPQYIARVSAAFGNNGQGVRGDMKAVIKAILLDVEARNDPDLNNAGTGKLREPVLRLANWLRAFKAKSNSGFFKIANLDDPLYGLGETPMRSPTVFNFYRPGYVPPNSGIANAQLVAPEMQITAETSTVGYLNYMRDVIPNGLGASSSVIVSGGSGNVRDVKADYSSMIALASTADQLVDQVNLLLMANQMSSSLRSQIITAVNSINIPTNSTTSADTAKLNRVYLSIYLTMASSEYLVQK